MTPWTTLVDVPTLAAALAGNNRPPVVVDARAVLADRSAARAAYRVGHVPGARFVELDTELSGPHAPGAGRHPWPGEGAFAGTLARLGISRDDQVVVYDDAQGALAAARMWFLLKAWGHERVAVLDGGWAAWNAAALPVEAGDVPDAIAETSYEGRFDRGRLLDSSRMPQALAAGVVLIDARAPERYRGEVEPLDRKAGHIPGALSRPFAMNLEGGRFRSAADLRAGFVDLLGGHAPDEVIVSCGSGVTACHHLLAMEHAGLCGARLYTGSWSGWIEDDARPVATG